MLQGDPAFRSAAIAGYQSLGAGAAYPYNALMIATPTASAFHSKAATALVALLNPFAKMTSVPSGRAGTLTLVSSLNLYSSGVTFNGNVATVSFFTDSSGTQPAGEFTITLPPHLASSSDPTSYSS